jgi:hypothetical protein
VADVKFRIGVEAPAPVKESTPRTVNPNLLWICSVIPESMGLSLGEAAQRLKASYWILKNSGRGKREVMSNTWARIPLDLSNVS